MKLLFHAHTRYSRDGALRPAELAAAAAARGFSAVYLSDHFEHLDAAAFTALRRDCAALTGSCVLVPGYERDWNGFHLIAFGATRWVEGPDLVAWSDAVRSAGALVCLAHTSRYGHRAPAEVLDCCDAVEVWNSKRPYDGLLGPHPRAFELLDGGRIPLAGQDVHRRSDLCSLAVELAEPTPLPEVLDALRGRRYRMRGPLLSLKGRPGPLAATLLRLWHPLRRLAWWPPVRAYRLLRKVGVVRRRGPGGR